MGKEIKKSNKKVKAAQTGNLTVITVKDTKLLSGRPFFCLADSIFEELGNLP
jgi:hypothetical protein